MKHGIQNVISNTKSHVFYQDDRRIENEQNARETIYHNLINKTSLWSFISRRTILKQSLPYHLTMFEGLMKGGRRNKKHQVIKNKLF
jgi:hypothetical protein